MSNRTKAELEEENTALTRRVSELELRATQNAAAAGRKERSIWEAATRTADRKMRASFDVHWRLALAEAKRPLDTLIHRAAYLSPRPARAHVDAIVEAAQIARDALDQALKDTPRPTADEALSQEGNR